MKTPEEITQDVLDGMIGIGGCPSNEEFYAEFDDRLRRALSIANVVGRGEQLVICKKCGSSEMYQYTKTKDKCEECGNIQDY